MRPRLGPPCIPRLIISFNIRASKEATRPRVKIPHVLDRISWTALFTGERIFTPQGWEHNPLLVCWTDQLNSWRICLRTFIFSRPASPEYLGFTVTSDPTGEWSFCHGSDSHVLLSHSTDQFDQDVRKKWCSMWTHYPQDNGEGFKRSLLRINPEQMMTLVLSFSLCLKCVVEALFTVLLVVSWQCLSRPVNVWTRYQCCRWAPRGHLQEVTARFRPGLLLTHCHCLLRMTAHKECYILTEK